MIVITVEIYNCFLNLLSDHWKSASILSSATKSSENGLRSRSQSSLSVVGPNILGGSNRYFFTCDILFLDLI